MNKKSMDFCQRGPSPLHSKRKARKLAKKRENQKKAIEYAKTDASFKADLEKTSGRSFNELEAEANS